MAKTPEKNPAAVALGRAGGLKRAKSLTKAERSASASAAATARWAAEKAKVEADTQPAPAAKKKAVKKA